MTGDILHASHGSNTETLPPFRPTMVEYRYLHFENGKHTRLPLKGVLCSSRDDTPSGGTTLTWFMAHSTGHSWIEDHINEDPAFTGDSRVCIGGLMYDVRGYYFDDTTRMKQSVIIDIRGIALPADPVKTEKQLVHALGTEMCQSIATNTRTLGAKNPQVNLNLTILLGPKGEYYRVNNATIEQP